MKRLLVVVFLVTCSALALAADRIYTNPNPADALRKLFPDAAMFSSLEGTPLHFTAYREDVKKNPNAQVLGYAFWVTDLSPKEFGYHGPIHTLVGMDLAGILRGVVVDFDSEPYGYFSVETPQFAAQFKGKSIRDRFVVGADVDAISRASISTASATRGIRDASRAMARAFLSPDAVKK